MSIKLRIVSSLLISIILFCSPAFAKPSSGLVDGKTYSGEVGQKGDKKGDADDFEFKDGTFHSTACDQYGYTAAPYTATKGKDNITFKSTTKNDSGDTIAWNGTIKGDHVSGNAIRTSGKETYSMWFEGKIKK